MVKLAVVGMGCLFPGGKTPEQFYQSLMDQKSLISEVPAFDVGLEQFEVPVDTDALKTLDECFLYTHYIVHEALKSSGYLHKEKVLARCGMIMGSRESAGEEIFNLFSPAYYAELETNIRELIGDDRFEFDRSILEKSGSPLNIFNFSYPTLLSAHTFGLQGPTFAFDGACASSLYSVRLAGEYLASGRVDMMLAGGLFFGLRNKALPTFFESLDVTAMPGTCKPLDNQSGGMIPNEGGGAVVLKRLEDALRDRDTIHAVIDGVGWSNSGRGKQILAPSHQGQITAYQNAFAAEQQHGLAPTDIDYIECHATGTRVGDGVELDSLEQHYREAFLGASTSRKPLIGAVKGNIGHLLTASGVASLIKVICSMKAGNIPGAHGVEDPMKSAQGFFSVESMVIQNRVWPERMGADNALLPRRAAISAFGFGGSNAHLLLSQFRSGDYQAVPESKISGKAAEAVTAVVGLGARMGDLEGVKAVSDALYYGKSPGARTHTKRFRGMDRNEIIRSDFIAEDTFTPNYYFSEFDFDYFRNSVLPSEESEAVNKELILLKVASEALEDAGFERGDASNVAVIVAAKQNLFQLQLGLNVYLQDLVSISLQHSGIHLSDQQTARLIRITRDAVMSPRTGFDLLAACIGPIVANRISSVWNFTGPSIKLCSLEHSYTESLALAGLLLKSGSVDAVVVASVDGDPVLESRIWHQKFGSHYGLKAEGAAYGESAVAVVLKTVAQAHRDRQHIYAELGAIVNQRQSAGAVASDSVRKCYLEALAGRGLVPNQIGYLEAAGDLSRLALRAPLSELNPLFRDTNCALGGAALNFGQSMLVSEANSILKAILMLEGSFKPRALRKPTFTMDVSTLDNLPMQASTRYWLNVDAPRHVSVVNAGFKQTFSHVLVSQPQPEQCSEPVQKSVFRLQDFFFVLTAQDVAGIQLKLNQFEARLKDHSDLIECKLELLQAAVKPEHLLAVIAGKDAAQVLAEVQSLQAALLQDRGAGKIVWSGAGGSYFTARPLAQNGGVCLCYPPSGLNSPHAVYELITSIPEVHKFLEEKLRHTHPDIKKVLADIDQHQKSKKELPIYMDGLIGALSSQALLGVIGLAPDSFVGLSFGELVMNSVTDVYSEAEGANFILDLVAPFITRLSDPEYLKQYYNNPDLQWMTYFCKGNRQRMASFVEWIELQDKVHLTIYASPTNLVISGLRQECEQAAAKFGCLAYPISENIFVHTPPAMGFYDEIVATNLQHPYWINPPKQATYYKTHDLKPFEFTKEDFAANVANCICRPVNFQKIVQRAYADGARLFIGMDGGDLCENWIRENLEDNEAAVFSIKLKELNFRQSLFGLCARLLSHGVKLDLARLHGVTEAQAQTKTDVEVKDNHRPQPTKYKKIRSLVKTVSNEPATFRDCILTDENQKLFQPEIVHSSVAPLKQETTANTKAVVASSRPAIKEPASNIARFAPVAHQKTAEKPVAEFQRSAALLKKVHDQNVALQQSYLESQLKFSNLLIHGLQGGNDALASGLSSFSNSLSASVPSHSNSRVRTQVHFPSPSSPQKHMRTVLWDQKTVTELTVGNVSSVWGDAYREVDTYPVRARLPAPPFMFVSRVLRVDATFGELKPSSIETEFDIPLDAWYLCRGYVPVSVATESSHSGILLLSYIGVDILFQGRLRFRAVDSTFTAHSERCIRAGETCRGVFKLDSVVKNKNAVLIFYTYDLYDANNNHLFTVKGLGGLFSREELDKAQNAKGIVPAQDKRQLEKVVQPVKLPRYTNRSVFSADDVDLVQQGRDDLCFGKDYPVFTDGEQLYPEKFRVLSRVGQLDLAGGRCGLGFLVGEADIDPGHWVFDAHFPNDPVLPATFTVEGVVQLFVFFFHAAGLKLVAGENAERALLCDVPSSLSFRGEIQRKTATIRYEMTITDIRIADGVSVVGDILVYNDEKLLTIVKNMGIKLCSQRQTVEQRSA